MNEPTETRTEPTGALSPIARVVRSVLGACLATVIALATLVVIGLISWPVARGVPGIALTAAVGATAGALLRGLGSRPARVGGGLVGGLVAAFFAIAWAEQDVPGSLLWAVHGSALGALCSLPVAAIVATLTETGRGA